MAGIGLATAEATIIGAEVVAFLLGDGFQGGRINRRRGPVHYMVGNREPGEEAAGMEVVFFQLGGSGVQVGNVL